MAICREALELVISFEGYHRRLPDDRAAPYRDPVGIWTIAYGSIWRLDGTRVEGTDEPITREQGMALMHLELVHKCEPAVDRLVTVPMQSLMRGALISFCYNLGEGAFRASGLRRAVNEQRWGDVRAEFAKYRVAKGQIMPGLIRRRAAEAEMFLRGVQLLRSVQQPDPWTATVARAA
jgi:lysozyme